MRPMHRTEFGGASPAPYTRRAPPKPATGESASPHADSIREGSFDTALEYAPTAPKSHPGGRRGEPKPARGQPSRPSTERRCDRWLVARRKAVMPDVPDYTLRCDWRVACRVAASPASVYRDAARNWRQAAQQFQHGGLQRHSTIQSLQHQQPEHNQSRVEAIVAADAGFLLGLLQEIERQKVLKQRQNPAQGILINDRRERECSSCLKLGYRSMKIQASDFRPHSENSATPVMQIKNYVALGHLGCAPHTSVVADIQKRTVM